MKKLTLSESAWDLYRLKQLKMCWHDGLLAYVDECKQKRSVVRDIEELYGKKLLAKALVCLVEYK